MYKLSFAGSMKQPEYIYVNHTRPQKEALRNNPYLLFFAPSNFSASAASINFETPLHNYCCTSASPCARSSPLPHHIHILLGGIGYADLHSTLSASPNSKPRSPPPHPRSIPVRPPSLPDHLSQPSFCAQLRSPSPTLSARQSASYLRHRHHQ